MRFTSLKTPVKNREHMYNLASQWITTITWCYILKWFKDYLHNRTQFVKIGNTKSSYETTFVVYHKGQRWVHYYFTLYKWVA